MLTKWLVSQTNMFDTPFGRAIASICYESAFAQHFRRQAAAGGRVYLSALTVPSYSPWLPAFAAFPRPVRAELKTIAGRVRNYQHRLFWNCGQSPAKPGGYLEQHHHQTTQSNDLPATDADFIRTLGGIGWLY